MSAEAEEWRPIAGFDGYEVSSSGRVRSRHRAHHGHATTLLKPERDDYGYLRVKLRLQRGTMKMRFVHHLVIEAFVRARGDGEQCRHLNGDRVDNRPCNLAWGTAADNYRDRERHGTVARGRRHGTHTKPESVLRGSKNGRAALTESDVVRLRAEHATGASCKDLAARFGVSTATAHRAATGKSWAHVALQAAS